MLIASSCCSLGLFLPSFIPSFYSMKKERGVYGNVQGWGINKGKRKEKSKKKKREKSKGKDDGKIILSVSSDDIQWSNSVCMPTLGMWTCNDLCGSPAHTQISNPVKSWLLCWHHNSDDKIVKQSQLCGGSDVLFENSLFTTWHPHGPHALPPPYYGPGVHTAHTLCGLNSRTCHMMRNFSSVLPYLLKCS